MLVKEMYKINYLGIKEVVDSNGKHISSHGEQVNSIHGGEESVVFQVNL